MRSTARAISLVAFGALVAAMVRCTAPPGSGATASQGEGEPVTGRATAGPVCPVERNPLDPACAPRPVVGAVLIIQDSATGREVTRVTTTLDGRFTIELMPGAYSLVPQPVSGLMGGAHPVDFTVHAHAPTPTLEVSYDTGIR